MFLPSPLFSFLCALSLLFFSNLSPTRADDQVKEDPGCERRRDGELHLVAFGDSLFAGYELPQQAAFPVVLERKLKKRGYHVVVVNAGVSGNTTEDAKARIAWSVCPGTDGVILEFGGNDIIDGFPPKTTEKNLSIIIEDLQHRKIPILLVGLEPPQKIKSPVSYNPGFLGLYHRLAKKYHLTLYPSYFEGLFGTPGLIKDDGKHPTEKGVEKVVSSMLPTVEKFIASIKKKKMAQEAR